MPAKKQFRSTTTSSKGNTLPLIFVCLIFLIGFCTHILITVVFAETKTEGVIHACANKRSGELRIITNFKDYKEGKLEKFRRDNREDKNGCRENEQALEWNIQGPPGPSGGSGQQTGNAFPFVCPACEIFSYAGDRLSGVNMSNAIIPYIELDEVNLSNNNFTNANLHGANMRNANLSKANFERANLTEAVLEGANIEGVQWNNTICPDGTNSNDHNSTCEGHITLPE